MKTSPNGAPILSGKGVAAVKKIMEERFAEARKAGTTSLMPSKVERILSETTPPAPRPLRPLHEIIAPVVRFAERQYAQTAVRHPLHQETFVIVKPAEVASTLFEQALAAIAHVPAAKRDSRHEMEDE